MSQVEILNILEGDSSEKGFIGYIDVRIPGVATFLGLKVFRAGHTKWGVSIKPPYVRLSGKNLPAYSIEGSTYQDILSAIAEYISS